MTRAKTRAEASNTRTEVSNDLEIISAQLNEQSHQNNPHQNPRKDLTNPPLHLWQPELSGDIDIAIKPDGQWIHEGRPIERQKLVNLFASILRREDDGEYYLVTPVEKWRLTVEALPLLVIDFDIQDASDQRKQVIAVTTNTERHYQIGREYPLYLSAVEGFEDVPAVQLNHGLSALFTRPAWYRLAEDCNSGPQGIGIYSSGLFYRLG